MSFLKMCQGCGVRGDDVKHRAPRSKEYKGPCGDSFCYATCDSPSCRSIECILCSDCTSKVEKEGFAALGRSPTAVLENKPLKRPKAEVLAFFQKIEFHGHGANEVSMVFITGSDNYDEGRSIGNFLCSNVRLKLEMED